MDVNVLLVNTRGPSEQLASTATLPLHSPCGISDERVAALLSPTVSSPSGGTEPRLPSGTEFALSAPPRESRGSDASTAGQTIHY